METPEDRMRRAGAADEVAALVSFGPDRERLLAMAREWRQRAKQIAAQAGRGAPAVSTLSGPPGRPERNGQHRIPWLNGRTSRRKT
jgi:hypothetical protein